MTRDDIIRMADQAFDESSFTDSEVLRFAALVAAAEREACAKVCDAHVDIWIIPAGPKECAAAIRARG